MCAYAIADAASGLVVEVVRSVEAAARAFLARGGYPEYGVWTVPSAALGAFRRGAYLYVADGKVYEDARPLGAAAMVSG